MKHVGAVGGLIAAMVLGSAAPARAEASLAELADLELFALSGGTLFAEPAIVSMKEVHLDPGLLKGQQVVVEGRLVEMGEHRTYAVLADEEARLLVVLTDAVDEVDRLRTAGSGKVRMLGRLESGKKGLPYLVLQGLNVEAESGV